MGNTPGKNNDDLPSRDAGGVNPAPQPDDADDGAQAVEALFELGVITSADRERIATLDIPDETRQLTLAHFATPIGQQMLAVISPQFAEVDVETMSPDTMIETYNNCTAFASLIIDFSAPDAVDTTHVGLIIASLLETKIQFFSRCRTVAIAAGQYTEEHKQIMDALHIA